MSYVTIREDRFTQTLQKAQQAQKEKAQDVDRYKPIRRPLVGLEIKEDTYATLEVRDANGRASKTIKNTSTKQDDLLETYSSNFSVESITEQRNEKSQIVQTFGDDFIYFFGERPVQLNISLILPDAQNFRWHQEFWENYASELRGTSLARTQKRAYFTIDDRIFEGYLTSASFSRDANTPMLVRVQVIFLVTNTIWINALTNKVSLNLPNAADLSKFLRGAALAKNELTYNLSRNGQVIDPLQADFTSEDLGEIEYINDILAGVKNSYIQDVRLGDYIKLPAPEAVTQTTLTFSQVDKDRLSRLQRSEFATDVDLGKLDIITDATMRKRGENLGALSEPPSGWDQFIDALNYAASAVATGYYVAKIAAVAFGAAAGLVSAIIDIHKSEGIPNYLGDLVSDIFDFTFVQPVQGIAGGTMDAYRAGFDSSYNVIQNNEMEPTPDPVINFGSADASTDVVLIAGASSSPSEQTDPVL